MSVDLIRPLLGLWRRPVLLTVTALVLAILLFNFGSDYGIAKLFWHESGSVQILAGLGVALLFIEVSFIGYLLDTRDSWLATVAATGLNVRLAQALRPVIYEPAAGADGYRRQWFVLRWYLAVSWVPLVLSTAVAALIRPRERWPFLVGLAVAALFVRGTLWLFHSLHKPPAPNALTTGGARPARRRPKPRPP